MWRRYAKLSLKKDIPKIEVTMELEGELLYTGGMGDLSED